SIAPRRIAIRCRNGSRKPGAGRSSGSNSGCIGPSTDAKRSTSRVPIPTGCGLPSTACTSHDTAQSAAGSDLRASQSVAHPASSAIPQLSPAPRAALTTRLRSSEWAISMDSVMACNLVREGLTLKQADADPAVRAGIEPGRPEEGKLAAQDVDRQHGRIKQVVANLGIGEPAQHQHTP